MLGAAISTIQKAERRATEKGKPFAVVEMDQGDGRCIYIVPESYLNGPEFEAFEGEVIYVTGQQ